MIRHFSIISFFCFVFNFDLSSQTKVVFRYTNSYCGGAKPTQEIIEEQKIPKSFHSSCLIFQNAESKKKKRIKIDKNGVSTIKLKPGQYKLFIHATSLNQNGAQFDSKCKENLNTLVGNYEAKNSKITDTINLHFPCIPCGVHKE